MKEFNSYTYWRDEALSMECAIKTDHNEKADVMYAIAAGPGGVVTVGTFDRNRRFGTLDQKRREIAIRGLQPGDTCRVELFDADGGVNAVPYYIERTDRTASFTDVPISNAFNTLHTKTEDCFICVSTLNKSTRLTFRQRDLDPA